MWILTYISPRIINDGEIFISAFNTRPTLASLKHVTHDVKESELLELIERGSYSKIKKKDGRIDFELILREFKPIQ